MECQLLQLTEKLLPVLTASRSIVHTFRIAGQFWIKLKGSPIGAQLERGL